MGCVSSKILTRSGSFREELSRSLQRRSNGLEELLNTKNGGDPFLTLLYTANTVARKLKAGPLAIEPDTKTVASPDHLNSTTTETEEQNRSSNPPSEYADIETINTWELLADLEDKEEDDFEGQKTQINVAPGILDSTVSFHKIDEDKYIVNIDSRFHSSFKSIEENCGNIKLRTRSIRTVEEFDAMVATNYLVEHANGTTESLNPVTECFKSDYPTKEKGTSEVSQSLKENIVSVIKKNDTTASADFAKESFTSTSALKSEKGSRRKAMAKELRALKVSNFEFSKSGSLREWLKQGGQVFSPGSYVTPKFGNFTSNGERVGEDAIFDPELVAHLEQDMEQLTLEEEYILGEIIRSLEEGSGEGIPRMRKTGDHIEKQDSS